MAIDYILTSEDDLLIVNASGFDENLEEVLQYGMAIVNACMAGNYSRVLCNELNLEYRLSTLDTYKSAEFLARQAPKLGKVAIVFNEKFMNDARFWETVAVNRGLMVCTFKDIDSARKWLEG